MAKSFFDNLNQYFSRLSLKEQELLAKRLSFLIRSGVPILKSLEIVKEQTQDKHKKEIINQITEDVANGRYLYTALGRYKNMFGSFTINIIKVGEMSGVLDQNLLYLAEELKKKRELRSKLISAFVYPVFVTVATLGITVVLISYVFPKILPIFKSLNSKLPLSTRILVTLSSFFINYGIYLILGLIAVIVGLFFLIKFRPKLLLMFDHFLLAIPLIGSIIRDYNITNFCRTLGLLIKSDVRVMEALNILGDTTPNTAYRQEIQKSAEGVIKGEKISDQIQKTPRLFPPLVSQMIAIGETTGNLSDSLIYISQFYENEVNDMTKNLSNALEPILMVLMGLLVGFIAISIITPIYAITQNIHP